MAACERIEVKEMEQLDEKTDNKFVEDSVENSEAADKKMDEILTIPKERKKKKDDNKLSLQQTDCLVCNNCSYSCYSNSLLMTHMALKHGEVQIKCDKCSFSEKTTSGFNVLSSTKHDIRFVCLECDGRFKYKNVLIRHIKTVHLKIRSLKCPKCDYLCGRKSHLQSHIKAKHEEAKYTCNKCPVTTGTSGGMRQHIYACHGNIKYTCAECQKTFKLKGALSQHIKSVHLKIFRYSCSQCRFTTAHQSCLSKHIRAIHNNVRLYCDLCDFSASLKWNLVNHQRRVHENIKYNCQFCDYSVKKQASLKKHISRVHTEGI